MFWVVAKAAARMFNKHFVGYEKINNKFDIIISVDNKVAIAMIRCPASVGHNMLTFPQGQYIWRNNSLEKCVGLGVGGGSNLLFIQSDNCFTKPIIREKLAWFFTKIYQAIV